MEQTFVRNGWYAAGWSEDVTRSPLERWIAGAPLVFYRKQDGSPVALDGTCPHRAYPLALGRVKGDDLECGYHGITFACDGACTRVPGEGRAPAALRVSSYPLVERGGLIWIWLGDPARAHANDIVECWLADPNWVSVRGTKMFDCRASLLIENLLDLSHEAFLHPETIGNAAVAETPIVTETLPNGVRATRKMIGIPPPPLFAKFGLSGKVDRQQIAEFWAPGLCLTRATLTPHTPGEITQNFVVIHCVTPETATRTRYSWAVARDYAKDDILASQGWLHGTNAIFDQDVAALNAQEARMQLLPPDRRELSVHGDAAALATRKLLRELVRAESGERTPVTA